MVLSTKQRTQGADKTHVYGQQLQYQPEKKKMNTIDSVLQHTAITKEYTYPIPDEVFARYENQKSTCRNVQNKTKTFFFFDHFLYIHTPL